MDTQSKYSGLVTFNFFDKDGNLKFTKQAHNRGTPYLFYAISELLERNSSDNRPGKIMLTTRGEIQIEPDPQDNTKKYISIVDDSDGNFQCLRTVLPKLSVRKNDIDSPLYDANNNLITAPCVRYEFHISSYDLNNKNGIANLKDYRFWLLSLNEISFNLANIPIQISVDDSSDINTLIDNITAANVNPRGSISKVCAEVQLDKGDDIDYSLNPGEYISVLWDMYFNNNDSSN